MIPQPIEAFSDAVAASIRDPVLMGKVEELEHEAEVGESAKTPLILIGDVAVAVAAVFLLMLAIAMLAYRLA